MNIYEYLKKDHRLVSGLMDEVVKTHSGEKREALYEQIKAELSLHAETEEKTFYKELQEKGGKALQEKEGHAEEEHSEIRHFLREIDGADVNTDTWLLAFGQLKHAVEHHVEEEEGEIFEKAKKVISESRAEALAEEMDALKMKKQGKGKPDARQDNAAESKDKKEDKSFLKRLIA